MRVERKAYVLAVLHRSGLERPFKRGNAFVLNRLS